MNSRILAVIVFFLASCASVEYFSHSEKGFDDAPKTKVTIQKALSIAEPYLDITFQLRKEAMVRSTEKEPIIWVSLKGGWYYFVKDNYPSYTPGFYLKHAVKVNSDTGELVEPK